MEIWLLQKKHFARRLANLKYQVFITGSNARMLSRDIQTTLGGRYMEGKVYPYSFHEYLEAQDILLEKEWQYGKIRSKVQLAFSLYLKWGGFSELLLYRNKRHWLNDLYEKILLGDVILRNNVKNKMALRLAIKRLADNVMQPTSYNRLANLVKGTKKHYFTDNGLLSIFLTNKEAPLLENLCAIHLFRKYEERLFFYNKNIEVDFYVPDEEYAIQASYSVSDEETRSREVDALRKFHVFQPLKRMVIVTYDEEETIELNNGAKVEVIPAWKWLLEE